MIRNPFLLALLILCAIPAAVKAQPERPLDPIAKSLTPDRTLVYKTIGSRSLKLHVFEPERRQAADRRSAFVIFHGGGWVGGNAIRSYPFADYFRRQGMVGVSVEYRLHRKETGPSVFDCVKDARSAVRYVRGHAEELGIDPKQIVVAGCSAGGHLAAGTALFDAINEQTDDLTVSPTPNALILYYPVIDTSADGYGQQKIGDRWLEISPVHQVRADMPPTLHFHGDADTVTPYAGAAEFSRRMQAAGNECELVTYPDGVHGYLIFDLNLFDKSMERSRRFLETHSLLP